MRLSRSSLVVALVALAPVVACDKGASARAPDGEAHSLVGSPAPEIDLPLVSGGDHVKLSSLRGKVVLVDFWATWCAPCRASFPRYEALAKKLGGELVVLGISEDEEPDGIEGFARETGATFPLAWDRDKAVAGAYDPGSMPTSFVVDKNGLVRHVHSGYREGDEADIERRVRDLL